MKIHVCESYKHVTTVPFCDFKFDPMSEVLTVSCLLYGNCTLGMAETVTCKFQQLTSYIALKSTRGSPLYGMSKTSRFHKLLV